MKNIAILWWHILMKKKNISAEKDRNRGNPGALFHKLQDVLL